jgi:DNA-nicking Smr family endonuclease
MSRDRRRRLSADEKALWKTVTRAVKPLRPSMPDDDTTIPDVPQSESPAAPIAAPRAVSASLPRKAAPLAPLGRRARKRLASGVTAVDGRIDLHGHTQREAHDALVGFLHAAQARGAKVVLVVADPDPYVERGVLRRLVPQWLHHPELRNVVLGFETAALGHGGEGALYVTLRRRRGS